MPHHRSRSLVGYDSWLTVTVESGISFLWCKDSSNFRITPFEYNGKNVVIPRYHVNRCLGASSSGGVLCGAIQVPSLK